MGGVGAVGDLVDGFLVVGWFVGALVALAVGDTEPLAVGGVGDLVVGFVGDADVGDLVVGFVGLLVNPLGVGDDVVGRRVGDAVVGLVGLPVVVVGFVGAAVVGRRVGDAVVGLVGDLVVGVVGLCVVGRRVGDLVVGVAVGGVGLLVPAGGSVGDVGTLVGLRVGDLDVGLRVGLKVSPGFVGECVGEMTHMLVTVCSMSADTLSVLLVKELSSTGSDTMGNGGRRRGQHHSFSSRSTHCMRLVGILGSLRAGFHCPRKKRMSGGNPLALGTPTRNTRTPEFLSATARCATTP